jgi:hypothetical protein
VSCRLLTRLHLASFLQTRITYLRCSPALSRLLSSLHAVKPLYTARHHRGSGPVTGHPVTSRSARADSEYLARLAQANPGPFPGHIPARLRPLEYWQNTRPRLGPTLIPASNHCTSHGADHSNTTGTWLHPTRARARHRSPRRRTQQATEEVRCGYYNKAYVGARLKLYVQRPGTLELSYAGRDSHTMAPAVWHTVPSGRRTCWVRTPSDRHRTARCPHTCGRAYPSTYIFEPRPKAQVA